MGVVSWKGSLGRAFGSGGETCWCYFEGCFSDGSLLGGDFALTLIRTEAVASRSTAPSFFRPPCQGVGSCYGSGLGGV